MTYPVPPHDPERVAVLRSYGILETEPSAAIDALVRCAGRMFDMPISLLTLIDEDRQWFKSAHGVDVTWTDREAAFCNDTIMGEDTFVVEDAHEHPRFRDNVLVTGAPYIRFYAGAPLRVASGHALGSLCVIDRKPRTLSGCEKRVLADMACVATALIESHKSARLSQQMAREAEVQRQLSEAQSRELRGRELQWRQTERIARVGGFEIDLATRAVRWSDEVYRIHGVPIGTPLTLKTVLPLYPEADRLVAITSAAIKDGIGYDAELEIITAGGTRKWVRTAGDAEIVEGVAQRLFGIVQDITDKRTAEQKLWYAARHDSLTGLPNRAEFADRIKAAFARRALDGSGLALLMMDVDHLKEVNDTIGHHAGDALLRAVAQRLSKAVGGHDRVARIGGDEFVAIVEGDVSPERLAEIGAAIRAAMKPKLPCDGDTLSPQVSVGGAIATEGDTAELLRQKADLALYECKRLRRGGYAEFRDEMRSAVLHRISTVRHVDDALREKRIVPYYQPLVDLRTGGIRGLESLARMRGPNGAIIAAGAFHEALEDHRIAYRLTGEMLTQVAADARRWLDAGLPLNRIGINVTSADFQAGNLRSRVTEAFGHHEVPLKHVILEVTEMVFMNGNEGAVVRDLQRLREDGLFVAFDDFGTGFASLTQLRTLPVDVLKIDRSFVSGIGTEKSSAAIIEVILNLGSKLGLDIVAEGIETDQQARVLRDLDCRFGQGFLFARPEPADVVGRLLSLFGEARDATHREPVRPIRRLA